MYIANYKNYILQKLQVTKITSYKNYKYKNYKLQKLPTAKITKNNKLQNLLITNYKLVWSPPSYKCSTSVTNKNYKLRKLQITKIINYKNYKIQKLQITKN